jgi:allantoin racemase
MPQALIINPNTSAAMSRDIRGTAERIFTPPWSCEVANAPAGPESLESWRDYSLASVTMLPLLSAHPRTDGILIACFGDPGLYGLKETADAPVVGIAEAAMSLALLVGGRFGILAAMDRAVSLMDSMVRTYGLEARYAGTESLSMRVLGFESDRDATLDALTAAGRRLADRGADVLLLGCAGLTGFRDEISGRLSVMVIDPVDAGCRMLKALVEGGLSTARAGLYAVPAPQRMHGLERIFGPEAVRDLSRWEKNPENQGGADRG